MIFQMTIAVFLLSCCGKYCEASPKGNFFTFIQLYGPTIPGRCMTANCTSTNDGELYNCVQKYITPSNENVKIVLGLKRLDTGKDQYQRLDENGKPTGDTATFKRDDDTIVYIKKNSEGKIITVCCGSYEIKMTPDVEKKLRKNCVADGIPVLDMDNSNC